MAHTARHIVNTRKLANKGRFGDTELREVGGEESHVTAHEAYLIDRYGRAGEDTVESIGSGTINPETGKPEYFLGALVGGALSLAKTEGLGTAWAIGSSLIGGFGAAKSAKAARKKEMKSMRGAVSKIQHAQDQKGKQALIDLERMSESMAHKAEGSRVEVGEALTGLSPAVEKMMKKQGGLVTGTPEEMVQETVQDAKEKVTREVGDIARTGQEGIDKYGEKMVLETQEMGSEITHMEDELKRLSKVKETFLGIPV